MAKRSENTYQKIDTIFKRDANNIIMPYDSLVSPELEFLRQYGVKFEGSEKIDGTNMRIEVRHELKFDGELGLVAIFSMDIKGKTDDAQIPPHLEKYMRETFTLDKVLSSLGLKEVIPATEWEEHKWGTKNPKTGEFEVNSEYIPDYIPSMVRVME